MDISVVVPVYRSTATLEELVERLRRVLAPLAASYEIILVDDASPDQSWAVVQRLQRRYPEHVIGVQLTRNFGQHNALMCGFRHARGEVVVTMDDDLQHPPEDIPTLWEKLRTRDLDLVYGRFEVKRHASWRNLGSRTLAAIGRLAMKSDFRISPFRIIRQPLVQSILTYALNFTFVDGLLAWNTQRIGEVAVHHRPRVHGRSGYSLRKLLLLSINLLTNFTLLPLQAISACGALAAGLGFVASCYYLAHYLFTQTAVQGYTSVILAVLILGGLQLLALGIMGEYVGRLHMNVNRKPQYVERTILRDSTGAKQSRAA
jgi:undecaprenyl-phosphate 4-deoxy-4-formamido-L-arabinose transferase